MVVIISSICAAIVYQSGWPSEIATFDFACLPFAVVWGILFFAEVRYAITVVGIVVAGILSVWR